MDVNPSDDESLRVRVRQLEQERDELHKDIEQLCMQQAGSSYLAVATKMHFQRISGLEQEIENLKKKIVASTRENLNLQEELSEAYRIKSQLADLHSAEVVKNLEAEKQIKFFQGCVATAFAERDSSMMEAEKAKEIEELMSEKFNGLQRRIEDLTTDYSNQKKLTNDLQARLELKVEQTETFMKVIDKFYQIRQYSAESSEDVGWDVKCACLLHDPKDMWSFNDATTARYISALENELEMVRKSADKLQNKLRMGLEIENHLKRRVRELEKKRIHTNNVIKNSISQLHQYHSESKIHIQNLLDDGKFFIKSVIDAIDEKIKQCDSDGTDIMDVSVKEVNEDEHECRDVHINTDGDHDLPSKMHIHENPRGGKDDASAALALALHDKVSALLLMSQQEERHLLDINVSTALQRKVEELQRNLLQVTNEKVRALLELAQLKQENQVLKEKNGGIIDQENVEAVHKRVDAPETGGRLSNLLKRTNLKRYLRGNESEANLANSMEFVRMKIENATLRESMESMDHLITTVQSLRLSLMKAKELATSSESAIVNASKSLQEIINEAKLVKTALGSSLPVSWSAETGVGGSESEDVNNDFENPGNGKRDYVASAGFEMVDLIILAAQILKDYSVQSVS